jgi:predicted O-methyltransferase YrrM
MIDKNVNHFKGIKSRLNIFKALLTKRNDSLMEEMSSFLDRMGHIYHGVSANLDPFSFAERINSTCFDLTDTSAPDFSDLANYDFLAKAGDVPRDWVSEVGVPEFVGGLTFRMAATTVIEVGCFIGLTSCYIAKALATLGGIRNLYCIDLDKRYLDITASNLRLLGTSAGFHPVLGNSLDSNVLRSIPETADLIYIDSSHEYKNTCEEIQIYFQRLSASGCLVLHDSIQWPGVRRAVLDLKENCDLITFATTRGNGLTVMMRKL